MASDNWKREAWQVSFERAMDREQRIGCPSAVRAEWASKHADEALALMEQREREGRFSPAADEVVTSDYADLQANRDEWMERAQRAEAEVERLKANLACDARVRTRAESLLKEALRLLRGLPPFFGRDGDFLPEEKTRADLLARARQEGFSDGE